MKWLFVHDGAPPSLWSWNRKAMGLGMNIVEFMAAPVDLIVPLLSLIDTEIEFREWEKGSEEDSRGK